MKAYILAGKEVVQVDVLEWGRWYQTADRRVAETFIGEVRVSTVFLGIDHSYGEGPPLLFETMLFYEPRGSGDGEMQRYSTWDEAEKGHKEMVLRVVNSGSKISSGST